MELEQLAAWGEFLGGIAVVAGLFFVGLQLRAANREARLAANRDYANSIVAMGATLNASEELADIYYRGIADLNNLTPVEKVRFQTMLNNNILRPFENLHAYNRAGRLEDHIWNGAEAMLRSTVAYPGVQEAWKTRKSFYNPTFRSFIDELIANESGFETISLYDYSPKEENDS